MSSECVSVEVCTCHSNSVIITVFVVDIIKKLKRLKEQKCTETVFAYAEQEESDTHLNAMLYLILFYD